MHNRFAVIVEDDHGTSAIFARALEAAGFATETIQSGNEALERLAEAVPDLVVLDLCPSHAVAADAIQFIRSDPLLTRTRVVVATEHPESLDAIGVKPDLVLTKPLEFGYTCNALRQLGFPRIVPGGSD